ncbi:helix-turn-helix domain-containing protein [Dactylosporangium sp. NPDC000244]|uniref:helix-turn-helix domain-containing protein n=1 Tax=Dactylosporangium sp. NPDC000244 TaxID=3154365 RepID=UPI003333FE7F
MLHRPAEVAKILDCSEWWVKEQARKRRIPFAWIGGSYRFTDEHLAEIIRIFEVRPQEERPATPRAAPSVMTGPLRARRPRRAA